MMVVFKVTPVFLLVLVVAADKKIELQDIEDDNLQSEKQKEYETDPRYQNSGSGSVAASDFLKNSFRYFGKPAQPSQPTRMYAVTEAPEPSPVPPVHPSIQSKLEYTHHPSQPQQAMVGYLSNVPMQIYLVPQYYNEAEQGANTHSALQYTSGGQYTALQQPSHGVARVTGYGGYQTAPEAVQTHTNYIEVPRYVAPTAKTYLPQYSSAPVTYVSYTPPALTPVPTVAPVVTYQVQYPAAEIAPQPAPQPAPKGYYQNTHYQDTNAVEEHESVDESPKQYTQTEVSYSKAPVNDYPRFYSARPPPREDYRYNHIQELPHPNQLLLKPHPAHLAHIPKALPMYKPLNKPVYGGHPTPGILAARPSEHFPTYKRRPSSLLDSYVPSRLQIEYMKRGFTNDPLQAYEDLSSGHHFSHVSAPRHFERGFLPNQMYHTASGGVTFGHYKRSPKIDKIKKN